MANDQQFNGIGNDTRLSSQINRAFSQVPNGPAPMTSQPISAQTFPQSSQRGTWRHWQWRKIAFIALLIILLGVIAVAASLVLDRKSFRADNDTTTSSQIKPQTIALNELTTQLSKGDAGNPEMLMVNGQLTLSGTIVLQAAGTPSNPVAGQLFFHDATRQLTFYNGSTFVTLQGSGGSSTNNITNIFSGGGLGVLHGVQGSIPVFSDENTLGSSALLQNGSTLSTSGLSNISLDAKTILFGNSPGDHTLQLATGSGTQNITIGSTSGAGASVVNAGTAGLSLATGNSSGASGGISILTGNSSTTASGNIVIDAGAGLVDGEVVSNKTFESGLDNMNTWFDVVLSQTSTQAHSGTHSLQEMSTTPFSGIIENVNMPLTPVIAGHQYYFSFWTRAATTPRTINITVLWQGASQSTVMIPTANSTTGWTEVTGIATAPAGATRAYVTITHSSTNGEIHYFDDFTITDLSSASALSAIDIGSTNAKVVTIGNMNQIGATSIRGGSGIQLNSGSAALNMNGGAVAITGGAASTLSTSAGALTVISAAAATWGVGTASSGDGGTLTLVSGNAGADDNNDGGDLILRAGRANGTGIPGSVTVWPQTDTNTAFIIQNSLSTPLFTADTLNSVIVVSGTGSTYATFELNNAHISSTQAVAPTITTPANCGTAPTAAVTANSTDSAGSFTITTGSGGTASTCDVTITFDQPYNAIPKSIIVMGKSDVASAARHIYNTTASQNSFSTSFSVSAAGANNTTYVFAYWIVQ